MPRDRKKLFVLACLLIFWVALILMQWQQFRTSRPTQVSPPARRTAAQGGGSATPLRREAKKRSEMPRLKLGRIERVRPPFEPEFRNIFASIDHSSAFPSSPPPKPEAASASAPPPPAPPDPFIEEAKKVRFLGYAKADDRAMAFVAYGGEVLVIPEMEVFGGRFRVKEVKEDEVILSSLDGTKEVLVGLGPAAGPAAPRGEKQRGKKP
ncbi:MAG: hypothetical protein ACE5JQ_03430 [Candidatus Methylomirabilales bacterium]